MAGQDQDIEQTEGTEEVYESREFATDSLENPFDFSDDPAPTEDTEGGEPQGGDEVDTDPETKKDTEPTAEEKEGKPEDTDSSSFFQSLSEKTGKNYESMEQLEADLQKVSTLENELKSVKENPYSELSPALQEAIQYELSGGNANQFFQLSGMDIESMGAKDALWEQYKRDQAEAFQERPGYVEKKFEREYKAKYGILEKNDFVDEEERSEWEAENSEDMEWAKEELAYEHAQAKKKLSEMKEKALQIPEQQKQPTEEELATQMVAFKESVKETLSGLEDIAISYGDGENPETYNFKLNEQDRASLQEDILNLQEIMEKDFGFGEKLDIAKYAKVRYIQKNLNSIIQKVAKHIASKDTEGSLKQEFENPRSKDTSPNAIPPEREAEAVGNAFVAQRGW